MAKNRPSKSRATTLLSAMMFLQFFVWGAWFVTVGNYMDFRGMATEIKWAYILTYLAAIIAPLFVGLVADRFFPTEKMLAAMHIVGGVVIFTLPMLAEKDTLALATADLVFDTEAQKVRVEQEDDAVKIIGARFQMTGTDTGGNAVSESVVNAEIIIHEGDIQRQGDTITVSEGTVQFVRAKLLRQQAEVQMVAGEDGVETEQEVTVDTSVAVVEGDLTLTGVNLTVTEETAAAEEEEEVDDDDIFDAALAATSGEAEATEEVVEDKEEGQLYLTGGEIQTTDGDLEVEGLSRNKTMFLWILFFYVLTYMPTLALVNTITFHNITDQEKQFPWIRVFGTIGWIVAGVVVGGILAADYYGTPFQVAGIAAIALGLFSFMLPHTPPPARGKKVTVSDVFCLDALGMLKDRSFFVFIVCSMLICIPLAAYYAYAAVFLTAANIENPALTMTFGQMSEIVFMLLMPFFFRHLGVKWMLGVGMLAWVLRYALFSFGAPDTVTWMILTGIILHGICYDFFFVTGQIYVDKKADKSVRGQAQGFLVLMTLGVGLMVGSYITGVFQEGFVVGAEDVLGGWQQYWILPAIFALLVFQVFVTQFHDREVDPEPATKPDADDDVAPADRAPAANV